VAKQKHRPKTPTGKPAPGDSTRPVTGLRIIGGRFRGRKLHYSGDLRTRPMKDRLREAIFNLVGPGIRGTHAWDLFAGTGALALEALSRGSARATLIEQHYPTADIIRQNIAVLGVAEQAEVVPGNVFLWWPRHIASAPVDKPWLVFCSPPYAFYVDRAEEMLSMIGGLIQAAPAASLFVVEADERFDFQTLPDPAAWDVRPYSAAVVGIYQKE
jgi:16S rRNA (guanine966-N2)-methyltransferase